MQTATSGSSALGKLFKKGSVPLENLRSLKKYFLRMVSVPFSEPFFRLGCRRILQCNLRMGRGRDIGLAGWMLIAVAAMFVAYIARMNEVTHDVFHEMALFREALLGDALPQQDVFAYTPTVSPSVHHEWATGAVLYWVTLGTGMGVMGLTVLKFLLAAALWLALYRVARMRGRIPPFSRCCPSSFFQCCGLASLPYGRSNSRYYSLLSNYGCKSWIGGVGGHGSRSG